jgi:hypothetical protein
MLARVRINVLLLVSFVLLSLLYIFSFPSIFSALEISQENIFVNFSRETLVAGQKVKLGIL